jgi:hypothetical protein
MSFGDDDPLCSASSAVRRLDGVTSTSAAGTAATEAAEPLHFDGWLELLRVLSELVAAAPSSGADPGVVPRPSAGR